MTLHGCKDCVIGNFVKFGGGDAMHHNLTMLEEYIFVDILCLAWCSFAIFRT
jgi:hypothetical protein